MTLIGGISTDFQLSYLIAKQIAERKKKLRRHKVVHTCELRENVKIMRKIALIPS
jgi:hypothetical protein